MSPLPAMGIDGSSGKVHRFRRWIVGLAFGACLVYLFVFVRGLLFEAQMSLGIIRPAEQGILAQIVNKERYTPPPDGVLRPSQIMTLHEVARQLDSSARDNADAKSIEARLVFLLNRFTMSAAEYRWVRSTATRYMADRQRPSRSKSDSANGERVRLIAGDVVAYSRFFRDSLDRAILL